MNRLFHSTLVAAALCAMTPSPAARAQSVYGAAVVDPRAPQFMVRVDGRPIPVAPAQVAILGRRVEAHLEGVPLEKALRELASQTGVQVVYSRDVAGLDRLVRLNVQRLTLAAALTELLFDKDLDVVIAAGNRIVIAPRGRSATGDRALTGEVHGIVTDSSSREPLAGAQIVVVGTSMGAVAGDDRPLRAPFAARGEADDPGSAPRLPD